MDPPAQLLAFAPPSETALLDFVKARVSQEMIHEIASNDRENDVEMHKRLVLKQLVLEPDLGFRAWQPMEVLEVEKGGEPASQDGHLKRLFACTILLRNVAFVSGEENDGAFFVETSAATVIALVRSSIALGSQASRLALGFLLWLHGKQRHPLLRPFVSFGVLLLQIQVDPPGPSLLDTCDWVEAEENSAREQLKKTDDVHSSRWLVGLNYQEDMSGREAVWAEAIAKPGSVSPEVESAVRRMRERLSA